MLFQKKTSPLLAALAALILTTLCACHTDKNKARFTGSLSNISEAEFYAYNEDGDFERFDTIRIADGKFTYECKTEKPLLLTLLYPNFTQTYVVLEPGKTIKMKGDAAKIGEASITGSDENELLGDFRQSVANGNKRNNQAAASQFIRRHAETLAAVAVFKKYFATMENPDAANALQLLEVLKKAQPQSRAIATLESHLRPRLTCGAGQKIPNFTAKTLDGQTVRTSDFRGKRFLVVACASWRMQSFTFLRRLRSMLTETGMQHWECLIVSFDVDIENFRRQVKHDSITSPMICDGQAFSSPLATTLGITHVPSCMLVGADGKIIARDITDETTLREKLRK